MFIKEKQILYTPKSHLSFTLYNVCRCIWFYSNDMNKARSYHNSNGCNIAKRHIIDWENLLDISSVFRRLQCSEKLRCPTARRIEISPLSGDQAQIYQRQRNGIFHQLDLAASTIRI